MCCLRFGFREFILGGGCGGEVRLTSPCWPQELGGGGGSTSQGTSIWRVNVKTLRAKSVVLSFSPVGSGQGGGDLGSALGGHRGARAIPATRTSHLKGSERGTHLSRAVSMAPGVWGLPLSASVAPRAFTSLGTGG